MCCCLVGVDILSVVVVMILIDMGNLQKEKEEALLTTITFEMLREFLEDKSCNFTGNDLEKVKFTTKRFWNFSLFVGITRLPLS